MKRRRLGVGSGIVALSLTLLTVSSTEPTLAAWTTTEYAASGALTAFTVPAPIIDTCTARSVLVGLSLVPRVVVVWHYPTARYSSTNARYVNSNSGPNGFVPVAPANAVATTGPSGGQYTSTFQGALLGGLLGGTGWVGVATYDPMGWTSKISYGTATFPLLVGLGTCTATNA